MERRLVHDKGLICIKCNTCKEIAKIKNQGIPLCVPCYYKEMKNDRRNKKNTSNKSIGKRQSI